MIQLARGLPPFLLRVFLISPFFLACMGSSGSGPAEEDAEALTFFRRAQAFYQALEDVPVDALLTYENRNLHGFFSGEAAFADYYSGLANQVRGASFRNGQVRLEILGFRLESPDLARVNLRLAGRHERRLRFWRIELFRTDSWRRVDDVWIVAPDKL